MREKVFESTAYVRATVSVSEQSRDSPGLEARRRRPQIDLSFTVITPMTAPFRENDALHRDLVESIPQGRGCDPREVSRAILFLASDEASYMNGHGKTLILSAASPSYTRRGLIVSSIAMVVDGGWTAHSGAPNFLKWMPPTVRFPHNSFSKSPIIATDSRSLSRTTSTL